MVMIIEGSNNIGHSEGQQLFISVLTKYNDKQNNIDLSVIH